VITSALAFPTTLTPLIRYGLVPVLVDVDPETLNPRLEDVRAAMGPRTRGVMLAHTLGNPFDAAGIAEALAPAGGALVEDCCDALGSRLRGRPAGSFGVLGTLSFYPAHHITTGEGGALLVNAAELSPIAASLRDWGRGCYCAWDEPSPDGRCGRRFEHDVDGVAYDHRYTYVEQGYNLKGTDLGASIGLAQLEKLPRFEAARRENFAWFRDRLAPHGEHLVLPRTLPGADPSWFAFPVTVRPGAPFGRRDLVAHLTAARIDTRPIFSGNVRRHPAFREMACRVAGTLDACDAVLSGGFFFGVYPGLTVAMREHVADAIDGFFRARGLARA
jgi:CDP-6-deoxy-D-xylo-4-hexulose-3-dehydrase